MVHAARRGIHDRPQRPGCVTGLQLREGAQRGGLGDIARAPERVVPIPSRQRVRPRPFRLAGGTGEVPCVEEFPCEVRARPRIAGLPREVPVEQGTVPGSLVAGIAHAGNRAKVDERCVDHLDRAAGSHPRADGLVDRAPPLQGVVAADEAGQGHRGTDPCGAGQDGSGRCIEGVGVVEGQQTVESPCAMARRRGCRHPGGGVGVEHENQSLVLSARAAFRRGEVVGPGVVDHLGASGLRDRDRIVRGPGVDDHQLIDDAGNAGEAVGM